MLVTKNQSVKAKKIYVTKLSKVDVQIPPQVPTGHSMASTVHSQ